MLDTLAVARQLTDGGVARNQAEVIAGAIGQAVEQGDHVTSDQFNALWLGEASERPVS